MPSKILKGTQLKTFRRNVARLKSMGLVSKRVDARKQKSTRYMREQVEKRFADVLAGKAVAVKVPRHKDTAQFQSTFDVKGKRVVVPLEPGASRPRYSKKTGSISGDVQLNGKKFKRIYSRVSADTAHKLAKGKHIRYTIPIGTGFHSEDTWEGMMAFMYPYETKKNPYKNWERYIMIDEFDTMEGYGEYEEDDDF